MFSFGSATFTWSARKMINHVEGSTERDSRKCKYSILEVHIPRKSARNIIKWSKGKYTNMRVRSICIDNGKYKYLVLELQSLP
jgi:hypothetical protein